MNRRFSTFFAIAGLMALAIAAMAAPRQTVVLEHFTNTSCGPCASNNPQLEAAVNQMGRDTCVKVSYHVNWPGPNDEFYLYNTSENQLRWNWYNVTGVPDLVIGNLSPSYPFNTANIKSMVRSEFGEDCPVWFTETVALETSPTQIHVQGVLNAESGSNLANLKLFATIITTNVDPYNAPNGEDHISEPFRDHGWHATQGSAITATPETPQDFEVNLTKSASWDRDDLEIVVWVQNITSKDIVQGYVIDVSSEYSFTTSNDNPAQQIIPSNVGEQTYLIGLNNVGTMDDSYNVTLDCDWPTGWAYSIEEVGGVSNPTNIAISLASGEETFVVVRANPNTHAGSAAFTVTIESDNSDLITQTFTYRLMSGLDVLVIDADGGQDYETYYAEALASADDEINMVWGWWDSSLDDVDVTLFEDIDVLVWFTGDRWQETLTPLDQINIQEYLDNGGNMLLSGQGIGFDMRNDQFYQEYMNAQFLRNFPIGTSVTGLAGTAGEGLALSIVDGDGADNQIRQSAIAARDGDAVVALNYDQQFQGETQGAALQTDNGTYRLLYLAFGLEAIADAAGRANMMRAAMEFLYQPSATPEAPTTLPTEFSLAQNYPNPFNPETSIPFALPARANVKLAVFDLLGREVATLVDGTYEAGQHTASFNGASLSSGVYFYRLEAQAGDANFSSTRKLVLMK